MRIRSAARAVVASPHVSHHDVIRVVAQLGVHQIPRRPDSALQPSRSEHKVA